MTSIVDFIFLIFAAFLGKKALLLSVFAFAPSVLANDIPLATLSVENIQVRAEWNVVGDSANHFSVEGGTLMLRPNISGGEDGKTITAIVEVNDKFSTLNPSYKDLTVRVMITAVIMGCSADWTKRFAKSRDKEDSQPPNQIVVFPGEIGDGDVIARREFKNGYNHIYLYTVSATHGANGIYTYITTSPSLSAHLLWDYGGNSTGYTLLEVNESECFDEEVKTFQEQQEKFEYLNANAPLVSAVTVAYGVIAVEGRAVTVASAFLSDDGNQVFYVNVSLGNILNELYPPKVIIDDGKAFSISGKYPIGNSYAYFANLTVGSDSVDKQSPHEVIIFNGDCPTPLIVSAWLFSNLLRINQSETGKVAAYPYVLIDGEVYKFNNELPLATDAGGGYVVSAEGFDASSLTGGSRKIKFADHFLCGTE